MFLDVILFAPFRFILTMQQKHINLTNLNILTKCTSQTLKGTTITDATRCWHTIGQTQPKGNQRPDV